MLHAAVTITEKSSSYINYPAFAVVFLIFGAIGALVGFLIGRGKGRGGLGAVLGFFFGLIGWIITAILPRREQQPAPAPYAPVS